MHKSVVAFCSSLADYLRTQRFFSHFACVSVYFNAQRFCCCNATAVVRLNKYKMCICIVKEQNGGSFAAMIFQAWKEIANATWTSSENFQFFFSFLLLYGNLIEKLWIVHILLFHSTKAYTLHRFICINKLIWRQRNEMNLKNSINLLWKKNYMNCNSAYRFRCYSYLLFESIEVYWLHHRIIANRQSLKRKYLYPFKICACTTKSRRLFL